MGATTTDPVSADEDTALTFVGAALPDPFLDPDIDVELLDPTDDLLALFEVRHQLERYRDGFD